MNMKKAMMLKFRKLSLTSIFTVCLAVWLIPNIHAAPLNLYDYPLDTASGVDPNILFTIDDSGSMGWNFMPDGICCATGQRRMSSSAFNTIYYNPTVRYVPPVDRNGVSLGNSTFTSAASDGFTGAGCTVNLSTNYRARYTGDACTGIDMANNPTGGAGPAWYYVFDNTNAGCDGTTGDEDCYDAVVITAGNAPFTFGGPNRTDCATPTSCTYAEESQNFANWYTYYRSRLLLTKTAVSRAFATIPSNVRLSYQGINRDTTIPLFRPFADSPAVSGPPALPANTRRTDFYNWLQNSVTAGGGTPLRNAFDNAGREFQRSGTNSPYAAYPGVVSTEHSCRQNFHIAFTDGYWNGGFGDPNSINNFDNNNQTFPTTTSTSSVPVTTYNQPNPYRGATSDTLADITLYYWLNDLRPGGGGLANNVPTYTKEKRDYDGDLDIDNSDNFWNPVNDPADWQHMTTFTVGLGVSGTLAFNSTTYQNLIDGTQSWPAIAAGTNTTIDDLWHAAINGRGQFFSATDPATLITSFNDVLSSIADRTGSAAAVAAAGSRYQSGTLIFQPIFDTSDWSGDLRAFDITDLSTILASAQTKLDSQDYNTGRNIITYNPSTNLGVAFRHSNLSTAQQAAITSNQLDYIRGDDSNEVKNGGSFRNRQHKLGDIVNSEPAFVGPPSRLFPNTLESASYSAFASTHSSRKSILWVGANDGMLHGFDVTYDPDPDNDASTPPPALPSTFFNEVLAFVPSKVYNNLAGLTSSSGFQHKFFVDGSPLERDVFYSGAWHTMLVGGLNAGGQGIYALDITDPSLFGEGNANSLIMWEFNDDHDGDLGNTYSQPQIAKMNNGKWMVITGNGYNNTASDDVNGYCSDSNPATICPVSTTGDAILFILDAENGPATTYYKLSTETGMAEDPKGSSTPNGLSSLALSDTDGNFTVDYIYAGDLFGNLWKFDVRDSNPANWTVYKTKSGTPTPLFIATDDLGNRQPITSAPVAASHPSQTGRLIHFGTGKYLEFVDIDDDSLQSFYTVWDRDESSITTIGRSHTFQQQILFSTTLQFTNSNARVTTNDTFNYYIGKGLPTGGSSTFLGWRLDLEEPDVDNALSGTYIRIGERAVFKPHRRADRIIFVTTIPSSSTDPCAASGESWIMEMNAETGKRLDTTPFDYDDSGAFDWNDYVEVPWDANGDGVVDSNDRVAGSGIQDKLNPQITNVVISIDKSGGSSDEVKIGSSTSGGLVAKKERGDADLLDRRSWLQLIPD